MQSTSIAVVAALTLATATATATARAAESVVGAESAADPSSPAPMGHGPSAPADQFPSHRFQLEAHQPEAQIAIHGGLLQPLVLHGANVAADFRTGRLVLTYSHGMGLDLDGFRAAPEKAAGVHVKEPWTTGGGVGVVVIDELWVLADVKVHHFELESAVDRASYETVTVGGEVGWRFFVWKGLHVAPVVRFWPNVADTAPEGGVKLRTAGGGTITHQPEKQGAGGLFANLLVGWAFDL